MASAFLPFGEDRDHYRRAFQVFSAACNRSQTHGQWVRSVFAQAVSAKLGRMPDGQDELRMLGVGSGNGDMDCVMLVELLAVFPRIYNRVVEPSQDFLHRYEELAASKAHKLRGVRFDWQQLTFEEYEKARDLTKFHFISAFHCLYYVEDLRHSLMYMHDLLEPDGVLLVLVVSDEHGCCRLRQHFGSSGLCPRLVSSADIRAILEREGVPYSTARQRYETDVSECFNEASEEGSLLLDSVLNVVEFRRTASADLRARVLDYLAANCSDSKDDGKKLFGGSHELFVIKKTV